MNTTNHDMYAQALALFLGVDPSTVALMEWDNYGLPQFETESGEYAVGTDEEAREAAEIAIEQSVWAFNASFILSECGLPSELEDGIKALQEAKCEDANEPLLALVQKCCPGGMTGPHSFSESAILADGRGHFLSSYDSEENEQEAEDADGNKVTLYIYRVN